MKKYILSFLMMTLFLGTASATHLLGGYIHYNNTPNNPSSYDVYLELYMDCSGLPPAATTTVMARELCGVGASLVITVSLISQSDITPLCSGLTNCNGGTLPGARKAIYKGTFVPPIICAKWGLYYEECCLNSSITNIANPNSGSFFITSDSIDTNLATPLSSPMFLNDPPLLMTNSQSVSFTEAVLTSPADSVEYSLVDPAIGSWVYASYNLGYSSSMPMGSSWAVNLDNTSGLLSISPANGTTGAVGTYLLCIRVRAYQGSNLISVTHKNIILSTINLFMGANCCHASVGYSTSFGGTPLSVDFTHNLSSSPSGAGVIYNYDFNDGTTGSYSGNNTINHIYSIPATYQVRVIANDTASSCIDTCFTTVYAQGPINTGSLSVSCSYTNPSPNVYNFTSSVSSSTPPYSYYWDFGNGNASTQANPTQIYQNSGTYNVCLYVTDSNGDTGSCCQSIMVSPPPSLTGYIYADPIVVDTYQVYLIQHDTIGGGFLTAIDSQIVSGSPATYTFNNLSSGNYYTKAALMPNSPSYADFLPTYHDSVLYWSNAAVINFMTMPPIPPSGEIWMKQGNNPGGAGFIGGLISQGANKTTNDVATNVSILLLDANMQPVTHTVSDANGEFSFANLAYGTYHIYPEMLNKHTLPHQITISGTNPTMNTLDFLIQSDSIYATNGVAIQPMDNPNLFIGKPYPNPTSDQLNLEIAMPSSTSITLKLRDLTGRIITQQTTHVSAGKSILSMSSNSLSSGAYFLEVWEKDNRKLATYQLMKE